MQIQTFKIFCDLADSSSFSRAAELNGITQSAVSQQVRAMEQKFDVKLIERGRKNFSLTPEGRAFLDAGRLVLTTLDELGTKIQKMQNIIAGELRISTIFSIGLHELPPYLNRYRKMYPNVDVRVEYRRSTEVYMAVLDGRTDVGLVAYPSARRGLKAVTFWKDRLKLICSPQHAFASRKKIRLADLQGEKFIAFEPDLPTRREIDRKLKAEGVKVRLALEFDNIETVKRAVEIENAVSIVPETTVEAEVAAGGLIALEIDHPDMWRPLGALTRNSARVSPALREFIAELVDGEPFTASGGEKPTPREAKAKRVRKKA